MPRKIFILAVLLCGALSFAPPVLARAPREGLQPLAYDEGLLEAAEIATSNARKYSHRHCWRAVKTALVEANVVPFRPTSKYAWQAGEELEQKFSFKRLEITDPFEAPVGSILVYGGHGAGHVEFRTEDGFVSDFANPRPPHRPLLGVYVSSAAVFKGLPE